MFQHTDRYLARLLLAALVGRAGCWDALVSSCFDAYGCPCVYLVFARGCLSRMGIFAPWLLVVRRSSGRASIDVPAVEEALAAAAPA